MQSISHSLVVSPASGKLRVFAMPWLLLTRRLIFQLAQQMLTTPWGEILETMFCVCCYNKLKLFVGSIRKVPPWFNQKLKSKDPTIQPSNQTPLLPFAETPGKIYISSCDRFPPKTKRKSIFLNKWMHIEWYTVRNKW